MLLGYLTRILMDKKEKGRFNKSLGDKVAFQLFHERKDINACTPAEKKVIQIILDEQTRKRQAKKNAEILFFQKLYLIAKNEESKKSKGLHPTQIIFKNIQILSGLLSWIYLSCKDLEEEKLRDFDQKEIQIYEEEDEKGELYQPFKFAFNIVYSMVKKKELDLKILFSLMPI